MLALEVSEGAAAPPRRGSPSRPSSWGANNMGLGPPFQNVRKFKYSFSVGIPATFGRCGGERCGRRGVRGCAVANGDAIRRGRAGRMKRNDLEAKNNNTYWFVLRFILVGRRSQSCHNLRARSRGALHWMLVRVLTCCAALNMFF